MKRQIAANTNRLKRQGNKLTIRRNLELFLCPEKVVWPNKVGFTRTVS